MGRYSIVAKMLQDLRMMCLMDNFCNAMIQVSVLVTAWYM